MPLPALAGEWRREAPGEGRAACSTLTRFAALADLSRKAGEVYPSAHSLLHRLLELPQHLVAAGRRRCPSPAARSGRPGTLLHLLVDDVADLRPTGPAASPASCWSPCRASVAAPAGRRRDSSCRTPAASTARTRPASPARSRCADASTASFSGLPMNCRNCATALYSAGVRSGAVIVHRLAPPMIEFSGDLDDLRIVRQVRLAPSRTWRSSPGRRASPTNSKWMPAWPDTSNWSAALSRPAYLNVPSFDISSSRAMCFTCALLLISASAPSPSNPSASLANGMLCSALYCSNWIQLSQALVHRNLGGVLGFDRLRRLHHLLPGRRRLVRIEPRLAERVLAVSTSPRWRS